MSTTARKPVVYLSTILMESGLAMIADTSSAAVTPHALLQNSQSFALDNQVKAYRVPTVSSTGAIKYYDIKINLTINNDGTISQIADVTSAISPTITTGTLQPGSYKSLDGITTCTVNNVTLSNGRIQSDINCNNSLITPHIFEAIVATGSISSGHPYLTQLVNAGIDKHTDANTYTWGLVTNGYLRVGTCGNYPAGWPVGAKTVGNQLVLSVFSYASPGNFACAGTLLKQ